MLLVRFVGVYKFDVLVVSCSAYKSCRSRGDQDGELLIDFDEAQHAVAPGQVAVVWDGDWCLGCGIIDKTL